MKLCFLIYNYFPYGGQQRDFMQIASECARQGHEILVYTLRWQGEPAPGFDIRIVPVKSNNRLKLYRLYTDWVKQAIDHESPHLVIGFNKMPHLDVYFAADSCFREKAETQRGAYYKFTPRYRHFLAYEEAVFGEASGTRALVLSENQRRAYEQYYPYSKERLIEVSPGITEDRRVDSIDQAARASLREELGVGESELLLLQVGSGFKIKGVDRALMALASLPPQWRQKTRYVLVGQGKPNRFLRLARKLRVADRVQVLPGRDDIPRFFAGADLLLHPAYQESAGYVLLEATIAGLPVLTTSSCGYASHIRDANSGQVCAEPFRQEELNEKLLWMSQQLHESSWSENGLAYGKNPVLYSLPREACKLFEQWAHE